MKLFKNIDQKFEEIGFVKTEETNYGAYYERNVKIGAVAYTQELCLLHKRSGRHIIQSSEKGLNGDGFSNMVGLTMYEAKLCVKKMKEMGMREKDERMSYVRQLRKARSGNTGNVALLSGVRSNS